MYEWDFGRDINGYLWNSAQNILLMHLKMRFYTMLKIEQLWVWAAQLRFSHALHVASQRPKIVRGTPSSTVTVLNLHGTWFCKLNNGKWQRMHSHTRACVCLIVCMYFGNQNTIKITCHLPHISYLGGLKKIIVIWCLSIIVFILFKSW